MTSPSDSKALVDALEAAEYAFTHGEFNHRADNARAIILQALASISSREERAAEPIPIFGGSQACSKDGRPCYVGRDTDDAHWRCGTAACGALDPHNTDYRLGPLVVAHIPGGNFDGGDGAEHCDEHGLMRGEDG